MRRRQLKVSSTSFLHFNILKFRRKRKLDEDHASILTYSSTGGKEVKNQNPWDQCHTIIYVPKPSKKKDPSRGGRQQPHQTLKKFKKYKGGKKHHTMVAQSAPKMPK